MHAHLIRVSLLPLCPAMMERTNFPTFHLPCINGICARTHSLSYIHTHTHWPSCVTYQTKTKGLHTLGREGKQGERAGSETSTWHKNGGGQLGKCALRFNKEQVIGCVPLDVQGLSMLCDGVITPEHSGEILAYVCSSMTNVILSHGGIPRLRILTRKQKKQENISCLLFF